MRNLRTNQNPIVLVCCTKSLKDRIPTHALTPLGTQSQPPKSTVRESLLAVVNI